MTREQAEQEVRSLMDAVDRRTRTYETLHPARRASVEMLQKNREQGTTESLAAMRAADGKVKEIEEELKRLNAEVQAASTLMILDLVAPR